MLYLLCSSIMPHSAACGSHSSASSPCHFLRSSLLVFLWLMVYHSVDMLRFILLFCLGKNLSCFRLKNVVFTRGTLLPSWQQLESCCLRYVIGFHGDLLLGSKFLWVTVDILTPRMSWCLVAMGSHVRMAVRLESGVGRWV